MKKSWSLFVVKFKNIYLKSPIIRITYFNEITFLKEAIRSYPENQKLSV